MSNIEFVEEAKRIVCGYVYEHLDPTDEVYFHGEEDVYVVWLSKVLRNNKALLSTGLCDGMYYEVTYNGDTNEFYLDAYKKFENRCIKA